MGWKPYRGSGIGFEKAFNNELKYRMRLREIETHSVGSMEHSKTYYHWLIAERNLRKFSPTLATTLEELYGELLSESTLKSFAQHKELCYKPLQKYIK